MAEDSGQTEARGSTHNGDHHVKTVCTVKIIGGSRPCLSASDSRFVKGVNSLPPRTSLPGKADLTRPPPSSPSAPAQDIYRIMRIKVMPLMRSWVTVPKEADPGDFSALAELCTTDAKEVYVTYQRHVSRHRRPLSTLIDPLPPVIHVLPSSLSP